MYIFWIKNEELLNAKLKSSSLLDQVSMEQAGYACGNRDMNKTQPLTRHADYLRGKWILK